MKRRVIFAEKCASLSVVLCPLCEPYRLFGLSLDFLLIIVSSLFVFVGTLQQRVKLYLPKQLLLFTLYAITVPVYWGVSNGYASDITGELKTILVFVFGLAILLPYVNYKIVKRYYTVCVFILLAIFVAQLFASLVGRPFSALLPFFELKYDSTDMASFIAGQRGKDRFCSMFLEPSHFAQYLIPMLVIKLDDCFNSNKYFDTPTIVLSFFLLLIRSGVGLILCALTWAITLISAKLDKRRKAFIIVSACILAIIFVPLYLKSNIGSEVAKRSSELAYSEDSNTSGSKRLYNGYLAYMDLPSPLKITGVSSGGLETAVERSQFSFLFDNSMFLNVIHILLLGYGIIGLVLFFFFIGSQFKKVNDKGKRIFILFSILCFMEGFFFTGKMFFLIGVAMCCRFTMGGEEQRRIYKGNGAAVIQQY